MHQRHAQYTYHLINTQHIFSYLHMHHYVHICHYIYIYHSSYHSYICWKPSVHWFSATSSSWTRCLKVAFEMPCFRCWQNTKSRKGRFKIWNFSNSPRRHTFHVISPVKCTTVPYCTYLDLKSVTTHYLHCTLFLTFLKTYLNWSNSHTVRRK